MINLESIKRIIKRGKMVLIPFGLVGATILTGCSAAKQEDKVIKSANNLDMKVQLIDNTLYDFDGLNAYKVNTYSKYSELGNIFVVSDVLTPQEFSLYTGEINITWDDIKTTINESNFDNKIKESLLKGVNNLENKLPNINLSLLNYNLKNIVFLDENEYTVSGSECLEVRGAFEPLEHAVYLPKSSYELPEFDEILAHEVLGHGMQMAYCDEKLCSTIECVMLTENRSLNYNDFSESMQDIGHSLNEGAAQMIAVLATGKKMNEKFEIIDSPYDVYVEQLNLYLKSTDTTLEEYINNGLDYLLNKMKISGCEMSLNYVMDFDMRKYVLCEEGYILDESSVTDIQTTYLYEIAAKKLENGEDRDTVIKFVNESVDSVRKYIIPTVYDGEEGVIWSTYDCYEMVDFNQLKGNVKIKIK